MDSIPDLTARHGFEIQGFLPRLELSRPAFALLVFVIELPADFAGRQNAFSN
jgi:hypothetical protein